MYVDTFYYEASIRDKNPRRNNLIIRLKKDLLKNTGALGVSEIKTGLFTDKQETILIDEDFFFTATVYKNETVIFHELGHTLLNRGHTNQVTSIMNIEQIYSGYCYGGYFNDCLATIEQREALLDELFFGG